MSDASKYHRAEIQDVLDAGPADDETWFRLRVQGKHKSKHLNITADQLVAIQEILSADNADSVKSTTATCKHCGRSITLVGGRWIDPEADGDDVMWRETCDSHDTFTAEHEPADDTPEPDRASGPPTLEAAIDRAKLEILCDIQAGRFVGDQITCFADLHDHMDANTLGGLADDDFPLDGDEQIEFGNALQAALDEWIKKNGMTNGIDADNDRWLTVGELRRHLAGFPDDTPITATNAGGVDYLNVVGASNPYQTGEPSLVLETRDDFDVRQF